MVEKTKCNRKTHIKENGAHVILIPENRTNILRRKNAIENAQESIDVINTWTRHMQAEEYYAEVAKKALQRGVKIRLLIDKPIDTMHLAAVEAKKCACFEVRYLDFPPPALLSIYDKALVFLATSSTAPLGGTTALLIANLCFVRVAQEYFESMWLRATKETFCQNQDWRIL